MMIDTADYRVPAGARVHLKHWATDVAPVYGSKKHYTEQLTADVEELSALQRLLYASDRDAVLFIFQGMDAAGKDGAIAHVLTGVNPEGCDVHSFKQPSAEELAHDFLWRSAVRLPARGRIGVFNRSYYEDVLIVRVHPELLSGGAAPDADGDTAAVWKHRDQSIVAFEKHLDRNGTRVVKFFLHLSKNEQRKRFVARIDDPGKNWKLSHADVAEREFWKQYMRAYEACLGATSTKTAPWYIVPADDKDNARLIVSRVVIETLQALALSYPTVTRTREAELGAIREQLEQD